MCSELLLLILFIFQAFIGLNSNRKKCGQIMLTAHFNSYNATFSILNLLIYVASKLFTFGNVNVLSSYKSILLHFTCTMPCWVVTGNIINVLKLCNAIIMMFNMLITVTTPSILEYSH